MRGRLPIDRDLSRILHGDSRRDDRQNGPARSARGGPIAGVGAASGPVFGGLLVAGVGWRAVFVVSVPVGIGTLVLAARHLPAAGERQNGGLDLPGQILGVVCLTSLITGLIEGGAAGWSSPLAVVPLLAFVPALAAFLVLESRSGEPMLPLSLFADRTFSAASFVGSAINLGFYGQLFALSMYFQHVRGFSALGTGLALLPEGLFVAIASMLSGRLTARTGPRPAMLASLTVGAAGFAGLIVAGKSPSYPPAGGPRPAAAGT